MASKNLYEVAREAGQRMSPLKELVMPTFYVSNTQHCRIMEILGIKTYKGKKEFIRYRIQLDPINKQYIAVITPQ